jgi:CRP/FNR family transcriptional regulator
MYKNKDKEEVAKLGFLRQIASTLLTDEDIEKIEDSAVLLRFAKGETILKQGNHPTHIAFLQSGIVKFNFSEDNSQNLILTIASAPRILGGANLFFKDINFFSIIAVEDCEVILIKLSVILELMRQNGAFAITLFQVASDMFKQSIINFISVASKQKEARIADVILFLMEEIYCSPCFNLSLTRQEIAEFACCSTENVIMTLSRWQHEEIITLSGKSIEIKNTAKLKRISKLR